MSGRKMIAEATDFYTPQHNGSFRLADEFGRDFPDWMKNVALGGFREQGWAAYLQPGGFQFASGEWGESLTRKQVRAAQEEKGNG